MSINVSFSFMRACMAKNMTTMKHIAGTMNEALTPAMVPKSPVSMMIACNGGRADPPTMAITCPTAPILASSASKPLNESPYIVGNINDIHADTPTKLYKPNIVSENITTPVRTIAANEKKARSLDALMTFISAVQINLKTQNNTIAHMW